MKELVCNYALIRFLPYRETGEFVNVGVVVYAPEVNFFGFGISSRRNRRVKAFSPELSPETYVVAMESLGRELERQKANFGPPDLFGAVASVNEGLTAFRSMLRRRESLVHFAEPGMRLGMPAETVDALYDDYVLRSFAHTQAYQEIILRNRLNGWLREWRLRKKYKSNGRVGDEMFHLVLPFVHFELDRATAAIKPIDLNRLIIMQRISQRELGKLIAAGRSKSAASKAT